MKYYSENNINYSMIFLLSCSATNHQFSAYEKFSKKLFVIAWCALICFCAYQGVRNISVSEYFAHELKEWYPMGVVGNRATWHTL